MSEEALDAENTTRNKKYTETDHLKHLLKVGHQLDSPLIRRFASENGLEAELKKLAKEADK